MALQGNQGLITNPNSNYGAYLSRKYNEGKVPHPSKIISGSEHIYIIDSRERDLQLFPNPAVYSLMLPDKFKNVTSIDLRGSVMPKTETNVNSENNNICFNVEDYVTSISIKNQGMNYVDGIYTTPDIQVTNPSITGGTQAVVSATVLNGRFVSISIVNPGTGYLRGSYGNFEIPADGFYIRSGATIINNVPFVGNTRTKAEFNLEIGNEIIATLRIGQYDFASPNDSVAGLCREVTRALQEATQDAIDSGIIVPEVGGPQTGVQYFPYSVLDSNDGSCFLYTPNENASENSNVCVQRGSDDGTYTQDPFLELLFGTGSSDSQMTNVLGFGSEYIPTLTSSPLDQTSGAFVYAGVWESLPVAGKKPYCLTCFPKYCILSFGATPNDSTDRIESTNETLDKAFATLIFDGNSQDTIWREPTNTPVPGEGNSNYSTLINKPGVLKGIKGHDFDDKILRFGPAPLAELKAISVRFQKINGDLYDFKGQDHLLIFNIGANDINSGNKW